MESITSLCVCFSLGNQYKLIHVTAPPLLLLLLLLISYNTGAEQCSLALARVWCAQEMPKHSNGVSGSSAPAFELRSLHKIQYQRTDCFSAAAVIQSN
jgi:hypothetical protein